MYHVGCTNSGDPSKQAADADADAAAVCRCFSFSLAISGMGEEEREGPGREIIVSKLVFETPPPVVVMGSGTLAKGP